MTKTLTQKQTERFQKAEALLPEGFEYNLHDEADAPQYYADKVWGVSLIKNGENIGFVCRDMAACTTCAPEERKEAKLLLNRVAAALWHKQPAWV